MSAYWCGVKDLQNTVIMCYVRSIGLDAEVNLNDSQSSVSSTSARFVEATSYLCDLQKKGEYTLQMISEKIGVETNTLLK